MSSNSNNNSNNNIKIHVLNCGSIFLLPEAAYCTGSRLAANAGGITAPMARRVQLPNRAFLIEHPQHGNILVDTGWPREISPSGVYSESAARSLLPAHLSAFFHPVVAPGETAVEQLDGLGFKPEDIDLLILTHLDADHICALKDFAGKAKRIIVAEDEYFWSCRSVYKARQPWKLWMPYKDYIEHYWFRGSPLGPNRWAYDVFGDESITCINCPGHTDGQVAVMVKKPLGTRMETENGCRFDSRYVLLCSDVAFSPRNWQELVIPGYGFDDKKQLLSLKWLKSAAEDENCIGCIPSHGMECGEVEW